MNYSYLVLEHFFNPRNVGVLQESLFTGIGQIGTWENGDLVQISIEVIKGQITQATFKAQASCPTIAACSFLTELIINKTVEEAQSITAHQVMEYLALPARKFHCSILAIDALARAILDVKGKPVG